MATENEKQEEAVTEATEEKQPAKEEKAEKAAPKKATPKAEKATPAKKAKAASAFAIIETGGKQFKVEAGTIIDVEKLSGDAKSSISFDKVLLFNDGSDIKIGTPYLEGASVKATILNQIKDDKKIVFKYKAKTGYRKKQGHRQSLTTIRVESLSAK